MYYSWQLAEARKQSTTNLKNMIWEAVENGQPVPGCMNVESMRAALIERGENGKGYHNS